ncbi:MAG: hypothetical protein ACLPVF_02855 [Acidimicrobiales bacterium]
MDSVRTPDERFVDLPDHPFAANYVTVGAGLHMHYVDAGPAAGRPVLLRRGQLVTRPPGAGTPCCRRRRPVRPASPTS